MIRNRTVRAYNMRTALRRFFPLRPGQKDPRPRSRVQCIRLIAPTANLRAHVTPGISSFVFGDYSFKVLEIRIGEQIFI